MFGSFSNIVIDLNSHPVWGEVVFESAKRECNRTLDYLGRHVPFQSQV